VKTNLNSQHMVHFCSPTIWALISDRLATTRHLSFFPRMDGLDYKFQGHLGSKVKTDLNSQHLVSYLLPIQYGHLTLTVWPQHAIYHCALCPKMDDLDYKFQGQLRSKVKTDLNSHHLVSYLPPIQYGHLSLTVWPQHAIYRCFRKRMTLNYEL